MQFAEALANPRFRRLLLVVSGAPILVAHLVQTVVQPVLAGHFLGSDFGIYLEGARDLAAGRDPYAAFFAAPIKDPTLNQAYIYQPLLAWLLQPLTGLPGWAAVLAAALFLQACLAAFLVLVALALGERRREALALAALLAIAFYPTRLNFLGGQVNLLLLALSGAWFLGWVRGGRWWAGAALGFAVAVKVIQMPLFAPALLRRRFALLAAAAAVVALAWLVAAPQYLTDYWVHVFPNLEGGTGFRENMAPAGAILRAVNPGALYGSQGPAPGWLKAAALLIAVGTVAVTAWRTRRAERDREGAALEAAAWVSATPLCTTLVWPSHAVLLLLPILVVLRSSQRRGGRAPALLAAGGWLLLGPVHSSYLTAIAAGFQPGWFLRPVAETGVLGLLAVWVGALLALPARRAAQLGADALRAVAPGLPPAGGRGPSPTGVRAGAENPRV